MKRIIDANLNRVTEALRVLEELTRFKFNNIELSSYLKNQRHEICKIQDLYYDDLLKYRNSEQDIGINIDNPTKIVNLHKNNINLVFKANIKRLQQGLRVLSEYDIENNHLYEHIRYKSYEIEKQIWGLLKMDIKKYLLKDKKLYLVTNSDKFNSDDEFLDAVASSLKGGVDIVQLREKNANAKRIIELGLKIRELTSLYNALFIVNDRVDIAKIVNADGVHLGQDDIDINTAREILGSDKIVGISTHCKDDAKRAIEAEADYIGVGPVFETPTKPGRKAAGLDYLKFVSKNYSIPFFAIGGINEQNIDTVIDYGAKRVAIVRAIINNENPELIASIIKQKLNNRKY